MCKEDELLFSIFDPTTARVKKGLRVLAGVNCSICMCDKYVEELAIQHNAQHPPICDACFSRLHAALFVVSVFGKNRQVP